MRDIIHINTAPGRRIVAVSDIHGHAGAFDTLIKNVGLSGDDLLVIVGDMIECGPDSLGVLRRAMELARRGNCAALCGNWEYFLYPMFMDDGACEELKTFSLNLAADYGACLLSQMCRELGLTFGGDMCMAEIMPRVRAAFSRELAFMEKLPAALDTDDFFFVHGGVPTLDAEYLAKADRYAMLKNDHFAESDAAFERYVIAGHWPVSLYDVGAPNAAPHINAEKRIVSIDGGMGKAPSGQLNALIMRAGEPCEFAWDSVDELPVVRALDAQRGSESPINIRWNDRQVELISRGGGICRVRHMATLREMDVPERLVFTYGGETCAPHSTDNMLAIAPGDVISVVAETEKGIFGKKDSVAGWYTGRYERV
jgi:hypothetical protein